MCVRLYIVLLFTVIWQRIKCKSWFWKQALWFVFFLPQCWAYAQSKEAVERVSWELFTLSDQSFTGLVKQIRPHIARMELLEKCVAALFLAQQHQAGQVTGLSVQSVMFLDGRKLGDWSRLDTNWTLSCCKQKPDVGSLCRLACCHC